MPNPTVDQLLLELEPLPHPRRCRSLAAAARAAVAEGRLPELLDGLARHGRYGRRLAALAATAGRDTAYLAARLTDPDRVVRARALAATRALPVPDEAIEAAFADASAELRRALADAVADGRRTALAERLVDRLRAEWGETEAARLLPVCSAEFVAARLPGLAHAVPVWSRLAKRHPDLVLDQAERTLAALPPGHRADWWLHVADGIGEAAVVRPERVLGLLERFGPTRFPHVLRHRLGALVAADAERTVRWLTGRDLAGDALAPLPAPSVLRRLAAADPASLPLLGRHWLHRPGHFAALLKALPPSRRSAFLDAAAEGVHLTRAHLPDTVLVLLPRERRRAEARRLLERTRADGRPWTEEVTLLAHLPHAEAMPLLLEATRRPEAADRSLAWQSAVANAAGAADPAVAADLLTVAAARLRNEQDPVRSTALTALAGLRPALFTDACAEPLGRLALDALQARDVSFRTTAAVRDLATGVLREHALGGRPALLAWALDSLEQIWAYSGRVHLGRLDRTLRRGQEHQVFETLRPWLERAADNAEYGLLLSLADALGRRADNLPRLQELLWHALQFGNDDAFAHALLHWLGSPAGRDGRLARVLELEPSAAVLPRVQHLLVRSRTDLLDLLLARRAPYGRFLKAGTRRPLPPLQYADHWTVRQVLAASRLATSAVEDTTLPMSDRARAIREAAHLPHHGAELALAHVDHEEVVLAEAALTALSWTDDPAGALPVLLARAGGDRARVAVYSASRAARYVPPSRLDAALTGLLTATTGSKVTARKEAARLAAQWLPSGRAAELLATAYRLPGQHPDVRAAVIAFAGALLTEEAVWALLGEAAASPAAQVRRAVLGSPYRIAECHRPRYARLIAGIAAGDDAEPARAALAALASWVRCAPEVGEVLVRTVTDLDGRATWREATAALQQVARSGLPHPTGGGRPGSLLHRATAGLLTALDTDHPDAAEDRDLPARQRLAALVGMPGADHRDALLADLADQLAAGPGLDRLRTDLLLQHTDFTAPPTDPADPASLTAALRTLAAALRDRPVLAADAALRVRHRSGAGGVPGPAVLAAATHLGADGGLAAGLLAVALLAGAAPQAGWGEDWRAGLRSLRRHPEPEVREAALAVVSARE